MFLAKCSRPIVRFTIKLTRDGTGFRGFNIYIYILRGLFIIFCVLNLSGFHSTKCQWDR